MQKLRIAHFVTSHLTTPVPSPVIYAPVDIALMLSQGFAERGHEVTYFAPEGSVISKDIKLETLRFTPLKQEGAIFQPDPKKWRIPLPADILAERVGIVETLWEQYMLAHMFQQAEEGKFDILHIHPPLAALPIALSHPRVPVVYTLHDQFIDWRRLLFNHFKSPNQHYIAISNSQRQAAPELNYVATVHHAITMDDFPFSDKPGDYLLFVGRLLPRKGVSEAIQLAKIMHKKLLIIGPQDADLSYWKEHIEPHLSDKIQYVGHVERHVLFKYYQHAQALLMPIQWEEPFGLVMIEAMACGTPVVGFRRGSVPEVVAHGKTGFVVDTMEEMVDAVNRIPEIDRKACRTHVEYTFSLKNMLDGHEAAYYAMLEQMGKKHHS
jgi:glycosyltransferase involved in cell wall biosynthesis